MTDTQSSLARIEAKLDKYIKITSNREVAKIPKCVTIKSGAARLGMPESTFRKLVDRRKFPLFKLGQTRLVEISELKKALIRCPAESETLDDEDTDP